LSREPRTPNSFAGSACNNWFGGRCAEDILIFCRKGGSSSAALLCHVLALNVLNYIDSL
jgi:hypothetical protein